MLTSTIVQQKQFLMKIYLLKVDDYVVVSINHLGSHCFPQSGKKWREQRKPHRAKS